MDTLHSRPTNLLTGVWDQGAAERQVPLYYSRIREILRSACSGGIEVGAGA